MTRRPWHLWRVLLAVIGTASPLWAQVAVVTERYDNSRTGANLGEVTLNTSNVNASQFGLLYSYAVDGSIQAQPLYVPNLTIPGAGTFNVLFVVTMNDVIYAFNADSNSLNGGVIWSRDLRNPGAGVTAIPIADIVGVNNLNIVGNVGIESTPVIDLTSQTMYLVARTKEVSGSATNYVARLHALDITTGSEKFGGPVSIGGSVPGTGMGSSNGSLAFDPFIHNQRSSLALVNGTIVFSWASHEDYFDFHGWIFAFNAQTLQQTSIYCSTPNGQEGGIWMAGRAPVVDASGNVYYATGNGDWDGNTNFGDSVLKLSTASGVLSLVDYFTPDTFASLDVNDMDLGSSGPILIPGTDLLVHTGKDSIIRVMHTSNLGHEQSGNGQIVQNFLVGGEIRGGMVFWSRTTGSGPTMYVWGDYNGLKAFQFNGTTFNTSPLGTSSIVAPDGRSGGVLTLSANGDMPGTGIVWSSMPLNADGDHGTVEGVLRAFNADDLSNELWDSEMNARDDMGLWPKYSAPTVVNGKVYMASFSNFLNVYGLLTQPGPPLIASVNPASGAQSATLSVAINGNDFQSGAACGFGPGINVSSCAFDSTNQLTAFITISPDAPLGMHDVAVVNPDLQSGTLAGGFSVTPPPLVTSVSPTSGGQGQLITVVIQGSNFQNGAVCSFGAGTVVNSCAFNSSSQLTATVAIRATATPGLRDVTVTDPDNQSTTLKGGFSVTPVAISLIHTATFSLQPSSSGTVTLALPEPTAEGHTLIVGVSFWPLDISSLTDSSGDTFTRGLPTPSYHDVNGSPNYNNFYYTYSAGGATYITLNFTGGSTYLLVAVAEVAGLDSTAPLDQTAYNESLTAAQNWSSGAVTTTAANEYLFSWAATEASNPNCSAPGGGWTIETQTNAPEGATVCLLDQIVSAMGPYQASVTASTAQNYAMEIATFVGGSASNQPPSTPTVHIDGPTQGAMVSGIVTISGWALDTGSAINSVQIKVDGTVVGTATYGLSRPDVCSASSGTPGCPNVGYSYSLNTSTFSAGTHTITVTATDSDGTPDAGSSSVTVTVQILPPTVHIDGPTQGATVSGIVTISGWALDTGSAINSVQIKVDGTVVGTATYGLSRPDVCSASSGTPGCPNVGYSYSLNTSTFSAGTHTITVTATDSDGTPDAGSSSVTVTVQILPPTVHIDGPTQGATVSGIVTISGWALDTGSAINSVQIKVDGTVVGTATYGLSRPDVCSASSGTPGCPNVGYSYSLNTSTFSAGTHTITVTATDSDGTPDAGSSSVTVTVQILPPTVHIDGPTQGATVSGIVTISGWALDTGSAINSVQIKVDGTVVGTATYGLSRPDVCSAASGTPGCPNVGYSYSLNTSTFSAGTHTITVTATDSDGTPDAGSSSVTVTVQILPPTVHIDGPTQGATVSGIVTISGWALDTGSAINSVQIKVDGTVVGTATYGLSRPDVCSAASGTPGCPNVGYSYSLNTSTFSAGTHTITVTATDSDTTPDSGSASVNVTR